MKTHHYSSRSVHVEAAENGYLVKVHAGMTYPQYICVDFAQVVNRIAREMGLLDVGEKILLTSSKDEVARDP